MIALRYTPDQRAAWDAFVSDSANGTFLHLRDYMDYHADRFADCSVMVVDDSPKHSGRIVAMMPANIEADGRVCSHRGLTYGGLIVGTRHYATDAIVEAFGLIVGKLCEIGATELIYKPIPEIYCRYPAADDLYALWRMGGSIEWIQPSEVIALDRPTLSADGALDNLRKATRAGVTVCDDMDAVDEFWPLLEEVLCSRHDAKPVHTLAEMKLLISRFPERIRLFTARERDELTGGMVVYDTGVVAHSQYIAISGRGRATGALAAITDHVVNRYREAGAKWFDFGTSCEENGRWLNAGLTRQKYSMGGRPSAYSAWRLDLNNIR